MTTTRHARRSTPLDILDVVVVVV
eukprot:COSAG06_NODE_38053_length_428_cov_0.586626_1_plen_23_part_10